MRVPSNLLARLVGRLLGRKPSRHEFPERCRTVKVVCRRCHARSRRQLPVGMGLSNSYCPRCRRKGGLRQATG